MHELGITEEIVQQILTKTDGSRIGEVRLQIGKLSGVAPESLRFCFELIVEGTALEGARLDIDEPDGRGACESCGGSFVLERPPLLCPCGSGDVRIVSGEQLLIQSVEVV